jgi:hypothetical protein
MAPNMKCMRHTNSGSGTCGSALTSASLKRTTTARYCAGRKARM